MKYHVKLWLHGRGPDEVDAIWLKGARKVEILFVNKTVDKDSLIMNLWSNRFGNHLQNCKTYNDWSGMELQMLSCFIFKESEDSSLLLSVIFIFGQHADSIQLQALYNRNRTILQNRKHKMNSTKIHLIILMFIIKNKWPISANEITSTNYTDLWTQERTNNITNRKTSYNVQQYFWRQRTGSSLIADLQLTMKFHYRTWRLITVIRKAHHW
jgi:hypothetical protein